MNTSRQKIIDYLHIKRVSTAVELSHILQVSAANVRHHLSILRQEGVVVVIGTRPPQGRGRPMKLYSLSQQVGVNNLGLLSSILMTNFVNSLPTEEWENALRSVATALSGGSKPERSPATLTQRLYAAIQRLNDLNYQARWEAHRQAPHILLGHCPYAQILDDHPEMCKVDAYMLEELLGARVKQTAKQVPHDLGLPYCAFVIAKGKP